VYVANVGDSRAVLVSRWVNKKLLTQESNTFFTTELGKSKRKELFCPTYYYNGKNNNDENVSKIEVLKENPKPDSQLERCGPIEIPSDSSLESPYLTPFLTPSTFLHPPMFCHYPPPPLKLGTNNYYENYLDPSSKIYPLSLFISGFFFFFLK
jgi:hypothetical protein